MNDDRSRACRPPRAEKYGQEPASNSSGSRRSHVVDWAWEPVSEEAISDLSSRLEHSRDAVLSSADAWSRGVPADFLQTLLRHWSRAFDWRVPEQRIRSYPWVRTHIDGVPVTAIHQRATDPDAPVVVLLHGWPDSFLRFERVLPLLTDVHAVIPCLMGFPGAVGVSDRVATPQLMADQVAALMNALGYDRYVVSGGDVGSVVATHLATNHGDAVAALHLTDLPAIRVPEAIRESLTESEQKYYRDARRWRSAEGGYLVEQATKPHTLAHALADSPAGLAAWIIEKLHGWSDHNGDVESAFTRDDLLTWVSLYWHTRAIGTSFDPYSALPLDVPFIKTPTAVSMFSHGLLPPERSLFAKFYNVRSWALHDSGGHFAAWEKPAEFLSGLHAAVGFVSPTVCSDVT
ncbi:alpha/beta fold hydrolase [Gordonia sp. 135]|nr:alpha/beta fold hydrolase [Gordonia sp. 135]